MKNTKTLMRSGHQNYIGSQRVLLYHLVNLTDVLNKKAP